MSTRKYNEQAILAFIAECSRMGATQAEMADRLNIGGYTTKRGKPWTVSNVSWFTKMRRRAVTNRLIKGTAPKSTTIPARNTIEAILTEPTLTNDQRVTVLSALMSC